MGIRLNTSIGYAMPIETFNKYCLLTSPTEDNKLELLDSVCSKTTELKFTKEDYIEFEGLLGFYPDVLAQKYHSDGRTVLEKAPNASELYQVIYQFEPEEGNSHIIFYPNTYYAKQWYRLDDSMDYEFERWKNGSTAEYEPDPSDTVKYVAYGPYPFTNMLMNLQGEKIKWDAFTELRKKSDWAPRPPELIYWWTQKLGIFNKKGVDKLQPIIAKWWC